MNLARNFLRVALGMIVLCNFTSCITDELDTALQSSEDAIRTERLNAAKSWFENQKQKGKTRSVKSQLELYKGDPSWKYFAVNNKDNLTAVDIDLTDCVNLDFVSPDNYDAFLRTGNWDFRRSYTRLVYMVDKQKNKEKGFLMTIIPSKYYAKTYSKRIRKSTYLHRDKYLSGYVLFHHLDGTFVNGWKYQKGKIIARIRQQYPEEVWDKARLSVRIMPAKYKVALNISRPAQTRSNSEDDWTYDGGDIPEVVITPDPEPDYPDWPEWPEWPEEPLPDIGGSDDGGIYDYDDESYGDNNEDDPVIVSTVVQSVMKDHNMTQSQMDKLVAAMDYVKEGAWGKKMYADMISKGVKIDFKIYTKFPNKLAFFDKATNAIYFNGEDKITGVNLIEEFIHAVQYNVYYGSLMDNDIRNFEFEAKVVKDIDCQKCGDRGCSISGEIGMDKNAAYIDGYERLIGDTENWSNNILLLYNSLGQTWDQYPGTFDSTITPELLINYLKK